MRKPYRKKNLSWWSNHPGQPYRNGQLKRPVDQKLGATRRQALLALLQERGSMTSAELVTLGFGALLHPMVEAGTLLKRRETKLRAVPIGKVKHTTTMRYFPNNA
jgi:hypothetical protein